MLPHISPGYQWQSWGSPLIQQCVRMGHGPGCHLNMSSGAFKETAQAERGDIGASLAGDYSGPIQVCL